MAVMAFAWNGGVGDGGGGGGERSINERFAAAAVVEASAGRIRLWVGKRIGGKGKGRTSAAAATTIITT